MIQLSPQQKSNFLEVKQNQNISPRLLTIDRQKVRSKTLFFKTNCF
jgi:hypothetical protein